MITLTIIIAIWFIASVIKGYKDKNYVDLPIFYSGGLYAGGIILIAGAIGLIVKYLP